MSRSEYLGIAQRWLATAENDLRVASVLLDNKAFAHACFTAQQAAEKAVKAVWYADSGDPWGHSVQKLLSGLPGELREPPGRHLLEDAAGLDRLYIPTRYPNGLPDLTPADTFFETDARRAIDQAGRIIDYCRGEVDARG